MTLLLIQVSLLFLESQHAPSEFLDFSIFSFALRFEVIHLLIVFIWILCSFFKDGLPHQLIELSAKRVPLLLNFFDLLPNVLYLLVSGSRAPLPRQQFILSLTQLLMLIKYRLVVLLVAVEKALLGRHVRLDGLQILAALEKLAVHLGFLFVEESRTVV